MSLTVLCFGQIGSITQQHTIDWPYATNTDSLQLQLQERYPALQQTVYRVAVNKILTQGNCDLQDGAEIALLPPFSGG